MMIDSIEVFGLSALFNVFFGCAGIELYFCCFHYSEYVPAIRVSFYVCLLLVRNFIGVTVHRFIVVPFFPCFSVVGSQLLPDFLVFSAFLLNGL